MKYLVTVEGMRVETKTLTVEAATEREAADSAKALIVRLYDGFNPETMKAIQIEELVSTVNRNRTAYLRSII